MTFFIRAALAAAVFAAGSGFARASEPESLPDYAALLAAPERTEADKAKDAARKPAEVLAKIEAAPGMTVIDIGSGGGYYAENLARAVAPGIVYAVNHPSSIESFPQITGALNARIANGVSNLAPEVVEFSAIPAAWQADIVFMGEIYHDVIGKGWNPEAVNAAIFNALKPGGLYVIEDHRAAAGADAAATLHRADPALIRRQVEAAGFALVEENFDLFANADDTLSLSVFDAAIRGKTARVLFIFRKPAN